MDKAIIHKGARILHEACLKDCRHEAFVAQGAICCGQGRGSTGAEPANRGAKLLLVLGSEHESL